jgi:hypothetical protein
MGRGMSATLEKQHTHPTSDREYRQRDPIPTAFV